MKRNPYCTASGISNGLLPNNSVTFGFYVHQLLQSCHSLSRNTVTCLAKVLMIIHKCRNPKTIFVLENVREEFRNRAKNTTQLSCLY